MSRAIKLGHWKDADGEHSEEERKYTAGWVGEKIGRFWRENKCEEGAHWVRPSIDRCFKGMVISGEAFFDVYLRSDASI